MPSDHAPSNPPPASPESGGDVLGQEEALFRALLIRVQAAGDKAHLLDRSDAALRLILNREGDGPLRDQLTGQIARLVAALPDDVAAGPGRMALLKAVEGSFAILRTAERSRLVLPSSVSVPPPPPPLPPSPSAPAPENRPVAAGLSAAAHETKAPVKHRPPVQKPPPPSAWHMSAIVAAVLVLLLGGLALLFRDRGGSEQQTRPLVAQMEAAAHGSVPAANVFGGALRVTVNGGRPVVTVDGIPPGECVSSGWDLVRKGVLTVNGATPPRVSAAKLNELCHGESSATLIWTPKTGAD